MVSECAQGRLQMVAVFAGTTGQHKAALIRAVRDHDAFRSDRLPDQQISTGLG
jgi:hypothetical protein